MARRFKLVTKEFQDYASDLIGIAKDCYINDIDATHKTYNYGAAVYLEIAAETWGNKHLIFEIEMPSDKDVLGFGELFSVKLGLYLNGKTSSQQIIIAIAEIQDNFDEGIWNDQPGYCRWTHAQDLVPWQAGDGAVKSRFQSLDDEEKVIDSLRLYGSELSSFVEFDLTDAINMGDRKRFVLWLLNSTSSDPSWSFASKEWTPETNRRPKLIIEYKSYPPDAFKEKSDQLTIKPNPDNPVQSMLEWGGVSDDDFKDYKIYRETTPFTTVGGLYPLTPIATITDPSQVTYIDTAALIENQDYYYMVIAEDYDNLLDDATKSALVSFIRPTCTHSEATETIDVGDLVTVELDSAIPCKRAYVEWGDAVDGYWVESEIEKTQFIVTHRYSETGAKVVKARLESSDGYWSDLDTVCTKTLDDKTPEAVLIVRPLEVVSGESVRCIGKKSQPVASDALISQYDYYVNGSWQTNKGPVFDIIPTSTQEIRLRIFTDTGESYTQGVGEGEDITIVSGEPTLLEFSKETTINMRDESRDSVAEQLGIVDGIGEIDIPYGIGNRVYGINGLSGRADFKADIDKIRDRQETQEYTRILVIDEKEGVHVRLDGRITGYRISQTTRTYVTWRFGFRVFARSEV